MFLLEWQEGVDDCGFLFPPFVRFEEASPTSAEDGVTVLSEERVGPYDTAVITADDPAAVVHWLADNGYQLGALGPELLAPYVEGGMHFLALRLAPDRELGDLQPIAMTYATDTPMIPIQLTAVATEPDLGVTAWILGRPRRAGQLPSRADQRRPWWTGSMGASTTKMSSGIYFVRLETSATAIARKLLYLR
ncbi:MAG: DUF2330 domain-containing protein [Candidatus Latescibacterota bacterium]